MKSYPNIRELTIFDLTEDKQILQEEFGIYETKEEFIKGLSIERRIRDLLDYAKITNDTALHEAVFRDFKKELLTFGFE